MTKKENILKKSKFILATYQNVKPHYGANDLVRDINEKLKFDLDLKEKKIVNIKAAKEQYLEGDAYHIHVLIEMKTRKIITNISEWKSLLSLEEFPSSKIYIDEVQDLKKYEQYIKKGKDLGNKPSYSSLKQDEEEEKDKLYSEISNAYKNIESLTIDELIKLMAKYSPTAAMNKDNQRLINFISRLLSLKSKGNTTVNINVTNNIFNAPVTMFTLDRRTLDHDEKDFQNNGYFGKMRHTVLDCIVKDYTGDNDMKPGIIELRKNKHSNLYTGISGTNKTEALRAILVEVAELLTSLGIKCIARYYTMLEGMREIEKIDKNIIILAYSDDMPLTDNSGNKLAANDKIHNFVSGNKYAHQIDSRFKPIDIDTNVYKFIVRNDSLETTFKDIGQPQIDRVIEYVIDGVIKDYNNTDLDFQIEEIPKEEILYYQNKNKRTKNLNIKKYKFSPKR